MVVQATIWIAAGQSDLAAAMLAEAIALFHKAGAAADLAHAEQLLITCRPQAPAQEIHR
jgi:hypothetical protein